MTPIFSIVVIHKKGDPTLPRLLESLKTFKDRGGEIVLEIGDERFRDQRGFFNFSKARNFAHNRATNDMVLSLDSDEVVTTMDIDAINSLIMEGNDQFDHWQVFLHDWEGAPEVEFIQSKFYNRRYFHWENYTHEQIIGRGTKARLLRETLCIDHWQNKDTDRSGYIKGLEADVQEHPEKDRQVHYYARELFYAARYPEAREMFLKHLSMTLPPSDYATTPSHMESMLFLGNIAAREGNLDEELKWYTRAIAENPTHRNPIVRMAHMSKWHGSKSLTRFWATKALNYPFDEKYGCSQKHFLTEVNMLLAYANS